MRHFPRSASIASMVLAIIGQATAHAAAVHEYELSIPKQPLGRSLQEFASQTGLQIVFFSNVVEGMEGPEVSGKYTAPQALTQLLQGSKLSFYEVSPTTLEVRPQDSFQHTRYDTHTSDVRFLRVANAAAPESHEEPAVEKGGSLEEIVVTAARREERLQTVPISVTALTSETLEKIGVDETSQLAQVTPGLVLARNSAIFQPTVRGVGSRAATAGDESNVAMYVDGIYQPETFSGAFDLLEIQRVEVLRGPQGTLFGRNSTGGLINVITADPSFDPHGNASLRYGRFDERSARGYVTGGLTDWLAADLAALYYKDDGYVDNLLGGNRLADRRSAAARSKLLFQFSGSAHAVLSMNYADQDDRAPVSFEPIDGNTVGRATPTAIIPQEPWQAALSFKPIAHVQQWGTALQVKVNFDAVDLDTATSYQENKLHSLTDSDASMVSIASVDSHQRSENWSQEVRVTSRGDQRFQWLAGVFGFLNTSRYEPFVVGGPNGVTSSTLYATNRTGSVAAFAEGTYAFTDAWRLTTGLRYTYEDRHFVARRIPVGTGPVDSKTSFDQTTPRVSLQYRFTDTSNVYATYSRGFKSGVFNTGGLNPKPVKPEILDAYEVGMKADLLTWLRTNLSVFYYKYKDIQLSQRDPNGVSILQNAAAATMKGGEAEITAAVVRDFDVRLGVAVLDATFDSFPNAAVTRPLPAGGNSQVFLDVSGNDVIRAPNYTVNLGLNYQHIFAPGTLSASANIYRSDKFYWDYLNRLQQPAFTQINAQIGWTLPDDHWKVTLWGENLTDKAIEQNVVTSTLGDYTFYQKPRTYGVTLSAKF